MPPRKLRICLLANAASVHTQRWAAYFAERGHEMHVLSLEYHEIEGATVHTLRWWPKATKLGYFSALPQVRRLLCQLKPDILHGHYVISYGLLAWLSRVRPLVLTVWGSDLLVSPGRSPLVWFALKRAFQGADLITCLADHLAQLVRKLGINPSRVRTMPFGVRTDLFSLPPPGSPRDIDLICTRNFETVYNVDLLIRALAIISAKFRRIRVVFAGTGQLKSTLEQLGRNLGVSELIEWVGWRSSAEIADLLKRSKVFVSPAVSDGTSTALTEAMSCGTFPVVTDIPANRPWIQHGVNGFLTPTDAPQELADRVITALSEESLRDVAAAQNAATVRDRADWFAMMLHMEEEYLRLATTTPAAPLGSRPAPSANLEKGQDRVHT